jgi:2-succinyl-6-hydroxy-2,4-cyclohexadiene-1-carboxylate synthase
MDKIKRAVIEANGLKIFCRDTIIGEKAILCLHGKWGRGETWNDFIIRYRHKYRIIAPDQRGHGLSDKPIAPYRSEDLANDAAELLKRLGIGRPIIMGHSMGGRIGAYLAALYPEMAKALIIIDCGVAGKDEIPDIIPENIAPIDTLTAHWPTPYPSYDEALAHLRSIFPRETNVRYFADSLYETSGGYDFMFSRYAMAALAAYSRIWYDILPKIKCPVLLVRATESWDLSKAVADRMRGLIGDCTYYEVSKSDHMVYVDNPDEFYPPLERFLNRIVTSE